MLKVLLDEFFANQDKQRKYGEALRLLTEIGMEDILRRLGEPQDIVNLAHPHLMQILSHDHAKKQGWNEAVFAVFNIYDYRDVLNEAKESPDFGAKEQLRRQGYTEKDLEQLP